jgi:Asp-tRNA(Asn)/Glu-tRNA(Gln) amidotransferase B subunit
MLKDALDSQVSMREALFAPKQASFDLIAACQSLVQQHPHRVQEYLDGKHKVLDWFIGQVLKQDRTLRPKDIRQEFLDHFRQ